MQTDDELERDDTLDDAWLATCLEERLTGRAPPGAAPPVPKSVRAAAQAAWWVSAAIVLAGAAVAIAVFGLRATGDQSDPTTPPDSMTSLPLRVLFVDEQPTWQYRYLTNALIRATTVTATQTFLLSASPGVEQPHAPTLPEVLRLPRTAAELAEYDVILLGDVRPEQMTQNESEETAFVAALVTFVEQGGGLGFLCGPRALPVRWRDSRLPELMPVVVLDTDAMRHDETHLTVRIANHHPLLDVGRRRDPAYWSGLGLLGTSAVRLGAARDGATTLLATADGAPLLVLGGHGRGRTMALATDETWRMRAHGDGDFDALWLDLVRWLGAGRRSR